ncbi:hypothetical protein KAU08_09620 [bacterium]|nr:hypothetical protein [bacterium]
MDGDFFPVMVWSVGVGWAGLIALAIDTARLHLRDNKIWGCVVFFVPGLGLLMYAIATRSIVAWFTIVIIIIASVWALNIFG